MGYHDYISKSDIFFSYTEKTPTSTSGCLRYMSRFERVTKLFFTGNYSSVRCIIFYREYPLL